MDFPVFCAEFLLIEVMFLGEYFIVIHIRLLCTECGVQWYRVYAVCRLYGCYENLQAGFTTRALQDLTGGIVQSFGLSNQDRYLTFQVLNSAVPRSSLLIASISPVS